MDIDEFLETETQKLASKTKVLPATPGSPRKIEEDNLFGTIETIKETIKLNEVGAAVNQFEFLKTKYTDLTTKQLTQNRFLFNELLDINGEIIKRIEVLREDVYRKVGSIQQMLNEAKSRLAGGDIPGAEKMYIEAKELSKQIPDIFMEERKSVNNHVTAFSVALFAQLQAGSQQLFVQKKTQLVSMLKRSYEYLTRSGGHFPKEMYEEIHTQFQQLPEGHYYEKALLYNDILKLFRTSSLTDETKMHVQSVVAQNAPNAGTSAPGTASGAVNRIPGSGTPPGTPNPAQGAPVVKEASNGRHE